MGMINKIREKKMDNRDRKRNCQFKILNVLNKANANMGFNEIVKEAKVGRGSASRNLKFLYDNGCVVNSKDSKYSITKNGVKFLNDLEANIGIAAWKMPKYYSLIIPQNIQSADSYENIPLVTSTVTWPYGPYKGEGKSSNYYWKKQRQERLELEEKIKREIEESVYPLLLEIFRNVNKPIKIELVIK